MKTIGVIVGRFQVWNLKQCTSIIDYVNSRHDRTVIVLGVSPLKGSMKNPLEFTLRAKMIEMEYPAIPVLSLADHPLDNIWSQQLDDMLRKKFPETLISIYQTKGDFTNSYTGELSFQYLAENVLSEHESVKNEIPTSSKETEEFRAGVIFAYSTMYPKVYPTVDVALFRNNRSEILLGRKNIDNKWRLLGGFTDPTDESYEVAALRELKEEAGPLECGPLLYEGSFKLDDWRYKLEEDKIITTLFSADFISGLPQGSDDIAEVKWFTLRDTKRMFDEGFTVPEHVPQFTALFKKYLK